MRNWIVALAAIGCAAIGSAASHQNAPMPLAGQSLRYQENVPPAPRPAARRTNSQIRADSATCTSRPVPLPRNAIAELAACTRLIADPPEAGAAWHKRAMFMHNLAIWQFASGAHPAALTTLDEIDALAAPHRDPVFDGSTGIANTMLRAILLGRANRQEEAYAILDRARTVRPHSISIVRNLDRIEAVVAGDAQRLRTRLPGHVAADPTVIYALFFQHFLDGELAAADAMSDLVHFDRPAMIGGWTVEGGDPIKTRLREEIEFRYLVGYIRAALGDAERSQAAFAAAEARLAAFVGAEPMPTAERRRVPRGATEAWQARVTEAARLSASEPVWRRAIALRADIAAGARPEILQEPGNAAVRDLPASFDLLQLIAATSPKDRVEIEGIIRNIRATADRPLMSLTTSELVALLPAYENLSSYPRFGRAGDGIMLGRETGYSQAPERNGDIRTIRFGTISGSAATAEELVMLAVATYAQREGKDSFILLSRQLTLRTTHISGTYIRAYDSDSGSEGAVLAVLIDSTAVPPEWEAHRARLIRAADIVASVGARQTAIEALKAAQSRR